MRVRPGEPDDLEAVRSFTTDTFEWGDYVAESFESWLDDEASVVMVAVDDGVPIGLARGVQLSAREVWIHGARVDPDHRRKGVGRAINDTLCGWAHDRGAIVARLMTEDWNVAAQSQVASAGYRRVSGWSWPRRDLGTGRIDPVTNGGRRVPGEEQLASGSRAEIDPAWVAWSSSEMATAGRGLYPLGWTFRRMTVEDVGEASRQRELLQCASGWVIARTDDDSLFVPWVVTNPLDAARLARAVVDLAARRGLRSMMAMVPTIAWLDAAFQQASCEISHGYIWAKQVG